MLTDVVSTISSVRFYLGFQLGIPLGFSTIGSGQDSIPAPSVGPVECVWEPVASRAHLLCSCRDFLTL